MLIYSPKSSNRLTYILKTLLTEALGLEFRVTAHWDEFEKWEGAKINYSTSVDASSLQIVPHSILFDHGIRDYPLEVRSDSVFEKLFFKNSNSEIPFDIFGAAFWLLARYEEYLPHKSDAEGRFSYRSGLAFQYDFLQIPLVNLWLEALKTLLLQRYPSLTFKEHTYAYLSTIDVDNVYRYKYKGFVRTLAGLLSDKGFKERKRRLRILLGKEQDPFDCYDFLIKTNKEANVNALYFFLLGDYGPNDKNHSSTDLRFQSLIKHVSDYSQVGLHPSFGSNTKLNQLKKEVARLGNVTHRFITKSRQHFSILRFPHTYKNLLQAGMTADYSLGYTNYNGFRASYCYPFRWYSMEIEAASSLILHPYCMSEVTLASDAVKKGIKPIKLALPLISEVKKYGGELISIFHNHTFTDEMKLFYHELLAQTKAGHVITTDYEDQDTPF